MSVNMFLIKEEIDIDDSKMKVGEGEDRQTASQAIQSPCEPKSKRRRENETKRWTYEEIRKILEYMKLYRNVEKPTAQIYYTKLIQKLRIKCTWHTLRCKMRYMRQLLLKANALRNSAGPGLEDGDGEIQLLLKEKIMKMCPHYDQLLSVFGPEKDLKPLVLQTTPFSDNCNESSDCETSTLPSGTDEVPADNSRSDYGEYPIHEPTSYLEEFNETPPEADTIDRMSCLEAQRIELMEKQLTLETEKFRWAKEMEVKKFEAMREAESRRIAIEERKLAIEERKLQNEHELRRPSFQHLIDN
ncbi:uncharacterized protein LOC115622320 [Scaptodrosophila lebanonensis]|uniref:Uncharacterized protein LOC115622320 n=1 Tax=Drosophila lebanonensis TaxID=7225 RepID=A0A6J2T581_DROLE|nr:uncharacterized protein LOC115622320 [Scaptodrosophila lebanonensis]